MDRVKDVANQEREWATLYRRLDGVMRQYGRADGMGRGDYWIVDDNWGTRQQKLYVNNLKLLAPRIVKKLQALVVEFPDWEIIVSVDIGAPGKTWPPMGLIIRPKEIIDGLQRAYFPKEFQSIKYTGSRRGPVLNEP
jgi:hypothetical protein